MVFDLVFMVTKFSDTLQKILQILFKVDSPLSLSRVLIVNQYSSNMPFWNNMRFFNYGENIAIKCAMLERFADLQLQTVVGDVLAICGVKTVLTAIFWRFGKKWNTHTHTQILSPENFVEASGNIPSLQKKICNNAWSWQQLAYR